MICMTEEINAGNIVEKTREIMRNNPGGKNDPNGVYAGFDFLYDTLDREIEALEGESARNMLTTLVKSDLPPKVLLGALAITAKHKRAMGDVFWELRELADPTGTFDNQF